MISNDFQSDRRLSWGLVRVTLSLTYRLVSLTKPGDDHMKEDVVHGPEISQNAVSQRAKLLEPVRSSQGPFDGAGQNMVLAKRNGLAYYHANIGIFQEYEQGQGKPDAELKKDYEKVASVLAKLRREAAEANKKYEKCRQETRQDLRKVPGPAPQAGGERQQRSFRRESWLE